MSEEIKTDRLKATFKERKTLMIVGLGYMTWGVFLGMCLRPGMSITTFIIVSVLCAAFYLYASNGPLDRIKAQLFPSHPDHSESQPATAKND